MTKRKDGGQAFPTEFYESEHGDRVEPFAGSPGMTLRDYFAGQALAGLLASPRGPADSSQMTDRGASSAAYLIADAMIEERSK